MSVHETTYVPDEGVSERFGEMVEALRSSDESCLLVGDKRIGLTTEMADILSAVAQAMKQGLAVSVVPQNTRMSTQEEADFLGISRSTLVRMLEAGEIPFEKVRRHRRLFLADVIEYQKRQRLRASDALSDMVADGQSIGSYDVDLEEAHRALSKIRSQK